METTALIQTSTYKIFQDRCHDLGLDAHRSLSNAIYVRMNKVENWSDDSIFEECCSVHNQPKDLVRLYLSDKFFLKWRQKYVPNTTAESASINLAIRDWTHLSRQQSHNVDYMASIGLILTLR
jgi:hypothetical protein